MITMKSVVGKSRSEQTVQWLGKVHMKVTHRHDREERASYCSALTHKVQAVSRALNDTGVSFKGIK